MEITKSIMYRTITSTGTLGDATTLVSKVSSTTYKDVSIGKLKDG